MLHNTSPVDAHHHREYGQLRPWLGTVISAEAFIMVRKKDIALQKVYFLTC